MSQERWVYRFDNFKRALALLCEAAEVIQTQDVTQLTKEGAVQRFEFTLELAWKVLKDYLQHAGIKLESITPLAVIKAAVAAELIVNGTVWIQALDARNQMSHTYDRARFDRVVLDIIEVYLPELKDMHGKFLHFEALEEAQ